MGGRPTSRAFRRTFLAILLVIPFAFVLIRMTDRVFPLESIEVIGEGVDLLVDRTKLPGNILFVSSRKLRTELLSAYPLLLDVTIQKKFPHTLRLIPTKRTHVAVLSSSGRTVLLDKDGVVLGDAVGNERLPLLLYETTIVGPGHAETDRRVQKSLEFLVHVSGFLPIERMTSGEGKTLRAFSQRSEILIAQDADIRRKAATLQTLVAGFRIKGTLPTIIDLRFDKPIVQ